jgi:hypothetical protein
MGYLLFRNGCYFLRERLLSYFFRVTYFIVILMVNLSSGLCWHAVLPLPFFFMRLFMPLDYLARILVIRNLIRLTRPVLCAQPRLTSPVGGIGYGVGVPLNLV